MLCRMLSALLIAAAIAIVVTAPAAGGEAVPPDLLMRWQKLRAENPDTGRVADLFNEGERIIQRLQELDDLRSDTKRPAGKVYYQRIVRLQDRFKDLLFRIEMARLNTLPPENLRAMREEYEKERDQLQAEITALEDSIIARGEVFLNTYKQKLALKHYMSKQEMIVDFIYRLAEIYYRRGEDQFFTSGDISVFKPALQKYQRIIDEFPASEYVDDALYNIAYIKNNSDSEQDRLEAMTLYKTLINKYQNSPFVPEAYWRLAEYHFYQKPPDTKEAIVYYSHLQDYPETSWYARGLYKIGWCHFLDGNYPEAINYFTQTVEVSLDSSHVKGDPLYASMLDEALEYISVCFAQDSSEWRDGGVEAAVSFVQEDSVRFATYGKRILEYLGDIYKFQVGKYWKAIEAYKAFLDLYPLDEKAPWVEEKIITTYAVNLREYAPAYEEKNLLFARYRAGTEWDQAHPDPELRARADEIIEKYYFQNINEAIGRAIKTGDPELFSTAVEMSRNYLETFPDGPNVYTVNFNLAVILDQYVKDPRDAYAEYIRVSRDYPDDKHRKESAVNAVVIAQKLIAQRGEVPRDSLLGTEITEAEQMYLDAVDNYLALFPDGEEAELFLLNAGSIYYNHGMYEPSRQYYRTLLSTFPFGERRGAAYKYIMNGYFAEGRYEEAEQVAKEIQSAGLDSTLVADAKLRQAEATFLHAQGLKYGGDIYAAANEYRRSALENPDYEHADKALFEAGLAYQEAKAWNEANEVYLLLVERYPDSDLADKALYNVGYNAQSELHDPALAASVFERLAREYPQSKLTQDALRNASINYVDAGDWESAIRVNTAYVAMFPNAPDANVFLFDNAGLYFKLGNEAAANEVYAQYASLFPDDPRTVRARWERGQYLKEQGRYDEALQEFQAGIEAHRVLVAKGKTGEETYASRCLYEVIQHEFDLYRAVKFAPAAEVESKKKEKLALRDQLLKHLEELNKLARDEMFEGLYMVGRVEEELALAFAEQELPGKKRPEEKILAREVANQDAIEINRRAMDEYAKAADDIDIAARVLKAKAAELEEHKNILTAWLNEAQKAESKPAGIEDSSAVLTEIDRGLQDVQDAYQQAQEWRRRAREKVPELALRNAEIKFATVRSFIDLPDAGNTVELRLLYRSGVLTEFAAPRSTVVIQLYKEAIRRAETSDEAEAWKARALEGVGAVFQALADEYQALNERALNEYERNYSVYEDLLKQGEGATTSGGLEAADIAERLVIYSDHSYEFAVAALEVQNALLDSSRGGEIPDDFLSRSVAAAIEEVFRINGRYAELAAQADESKSWAQEREGESVLWEDAVMTFEDCSYNFHQHQADYLMTALEFNRRQVDDRNLALRIGWALVDLDREAYLSLLADYGEEKILRSDGTFLVNTTYVPGWETAEFAPEGWSAPRLSEGPSLAGELEGALALWVDLGADSLVADSVYLRKSFEITSEPVGGEIWITADGGYALQLNGEFIGAVEPGEGWTEVADYDVSQSLIKGTNVIAVMAVDPDSTTAGVKLALKYKVLPEQPSGGP